MNYEKYYQQFLETNRYPRSLKSLETTQGFSAIYLQHQGRRVINFSSSDYLGLANHPLLIQRAHEFAQRYGVGSSASRLVTGNLDCYAELETQLARALNKPAALILGSGYQTNQSVLEALTDPAILGAEPLIFCDKLCHASLLAGVKTRRQVRRFQHNNLQHLRSLLEKHACDSQPIFIIAESVYSMEGDVADLQELTKIAKEYQAFLYIDDAHAVGVYGWGMTNALAENIDVVMGTFSKGLGSFGGYIGCSATVCDYLINKCRGLIYSTGLSPAILGAISAAIELLPDMTAAQQRVLQLAGQLRQFFRANDLDYGNSTTHIVPWIIGDAQTTVRVSQEMEKQGILATAIQPPSVPVGKSRLRLCLSALHADEDMGYLREAICKILHSI